MLPDSDVTSNHSFNMATGCTAPPECWQMASFYFFCFRLPVHPLPPHQTLVCEITLVICQSFSFYDCAGTKNVVSSCYTISLRQCVLHRKHVQTTSLLKSCDGCSFFQLRMFSVRTWRGLWLVLVCSGAAPGNGILVLGSLQPLASAGASTLGDASLPCTHQLLANNVLGLQCDLMWACRGLWGGSAWFGRSWWFQVSI